MRLLIKNGRLIDPVTKTDCVGNIVVSNGKIDQIITSADDTGNDCSDRVIDATGMWVVPGLIDVHVHLRDPGFEYKETIATGSRSAAVGGFTTICSMPNTNPVIDSKVMAEYIALRAQRDSVVHVLQIGAVTKGQKGEELADIAGMKEGGICGISEDGKSVLNSQLMKDAMREAKRLGLPVIDHCEDPFLAAGGCMNEGKTADHLGLKGISNDSEATMISRDIMLAESTGAKLHICHVSTKESVQVLREAHKRGFSVTAETGPHYFTLDDTAVEQIGVNAKMNPPLRSPEDVEAMRNALKDGTIGIIATDHAPHGVSDKQKEFSKAANGIVGLETSVGVSITSLVKSGVLTPMELIDRMSTAPAKMLGIDKGSLQPGKAADITIIDPDKEWIIDSEKFESKGRNTPFEGWKVTGKAIYTIVDGKIVMENGNMIGGKS